ncbi:substrate-binding domain-containing protein [Geodermatophilus sp. SYSU D00815]
MKNHMKAVGAVGAALVLTLSACGRGEDAGGEGGGSGLDIALVSKGFQHQFWQAVKAGAEEQAEELGVSMTFDGPASETEVDNQLQMLQSAIERQPDAIGYAALDPEACVPLLDQAQQADIPVVEFDAGCNSDVPVTICQTDSMAAGALAAEHMAELIGGAGKVAIVGHSQINSTGVERRDGFVEKIEADYPDIEIVDIQYGDGDHLKSADIAKAMLAANPDLAGLYGTNEGSAIGIVNAVKELGLQPGELTVVGFDSGQAQIDAIKSGLMAGAITQDPMGIGRCTVESAVAAVNGDSLEEVQDTGSYWYDANNVDSEEIQAMLYE